MIKAEINKNTVCLYSFGELVAKIVLGSVVHRLNIVLTPKLAADLENRINQFRS